jgi:lipopolysaccharide export system permease protein
VLELPGHVYELAPIAVLIGTIYTLSRLAQSSEFTILRTGGLGPGRALALLAALGLAFGLFTFVVGDFIAPVSEQKATQVQAGAKGSIDLGRSGAWLKDRRATADGEHSFSINIGSAGARGVLKGVRIFEFDANGRLVQRIAAASAMIDARATWALSEVSVTRWVVDASASASAPASASASASAPVPHIEQQTLPELAWPSSLSAGVVAAAVLPVSNMSTFELRRYIGHLADNEQAAQRYEIQFWKRALYPFACLVMVGLALPFAYLHARAGGVSLKVFGGIMLGISFVLLNNVASHLGLLKNWTPWIVAATPSVVYLLMSMVAFAWLVRYR